MPPIIDLKTYVSQLEARGAVRIAPGTKGKRAFGECVVEWDLDAQGCSITVTLLLVGQLVGIKVLQPSDPNYEFGTLVANGWSVEGLVGVSFNPPDQVSTLSGRLSYGPLSGEKSLFQGVITYWFCTIDPKTLIKSKGT